MLCFAGARRIEGLAGIALVSTRFGGVGTSSLSGAVQWHSSVGFDIRGIVSALVQVVASGTVTYLAQWTRPLLGKVLYLTYVKYNSLLDRLTAHVLVPIASVVHVGQEIRRD